MNGLRKYADETTIHGFGELVRYKSTWFRVVWSLILIGMLVAFIWDTTRTVQRYLSGPRATMVYFVKSNEMPPFAICTNDWMNPEKLEAVGVDGADSILARDIEGVDSEGWQREAAKEMFLRFLGPMDSSVKRPSPLHDYHPNVDFPPFAPRKFEDSWKSIPATLELLKSVMYTPAELNISTRCPSCRNKETLSETIVKDVGPCIMMRPGKIMKPTTRFTAFPFIQISMSFPNGSYFSKYSDFFLYVADKAVNPVGVENAVMKPYAFNMVDIDLTKKSSVYFCNNSESHVDNVCDAGCLRELEKECEADCMIFSGEIPRYLDTKQRVCNLMVDSHYFKAACWERGSDICALCERRCETTDALVRVAQSPLSSEDPPMIKMRLRFNNLFSTLNVVEYYSYSLTQLLGDFGGLLGLFLGASLISVSHAVYFCLVLPFSGRKKG